MAYIADKGTVFVGDAATSMNIVMPEDIQADDVIYVYPLTRGSGTPTVTITGFTAIGSQVNRFLLHANWFYKVAAGTEGGTTVSLSTTASSTAVIHVVVVRDAEIVASVPQHVESGSLTSVTSWTQPVETVDASSNGDDQLVLHTMMQYNVSTETFWWEPQDATQLFWKIDEGLNCGVGLAYNVLETAGVTPSFDYVTGNRGLTHVLSIKNKTGGVVQPHFKNAVQNYLFGACEYSVQAGAAKDIFPWVTGSEVSATIAAATDKITLAAGHGYAEGEIVTIKSNAGGGGIGLNHGEVLILKNFSGDTADVYLDENTVNPHNFTGDVTLDVQTLSRFSRPNDIVSTINSIAVNDKLPTLQAGWFQSSYNPGTSGFDGFTDNFLSAVDISGGKTLVTSAFVTNSNLNFRGTEGIILVFADSGGNWDAFQLAKLAISDFDTRQAYVVSPSTADVYDSSVSAVDYTDITKISYLFHRSNLSTNNMGFSYYNTYILENPVLVGGNSNFKATISDLKNLLTQAGISEYVALQGAGQSVLKTGLQIGDGTQTTAFNNNASSMENPLSYSENSGTRTKWNVGEADISLIIKASANDIYDFRNSIVASTTFQKFLFDAACSASATYQFTGCNIIGRTLTGAAGASIDNANVSGCKEVTTNGMSMSGCRISDCVDTYAVVVTSQAEFEALQDASFANNNYSIKITGNHGGETWSGSGMTVSGGTGSYDIEYTGTGTLTLEMDTGSGFTQVRSTTTGGGTLTVTVPSVPVTITVLDDDTGLPATDARVLVLKDSDKSEIINGTVDVNGEITTGIVYSADIDIIGWAREMSMSGTDYVPADFSGTISSTGFAQTIRLKPIQ